MRSERLSWTSTLTALLLGVSILVGASPGAVAHSDLVSSTPKDGATLDAMPPSVQLTFNEDIDPNFAQAVVADGQNVARPQTPTVSGASMTVPLPDEVPDGRVEVRYRIVSADGHPVAGSISFTAGAAAPTTAPAVTAAAEQQPASPDEREEAANTWMYALTAVAALLVAVVAGVILMMTRRRKH